MYNKYKQIIDSMKEGARIKKLNFINDKSLINCILNDEVFEMSSFDESMTSSGLNFSTFRSEDFPSFLAHSRLSFSNKELKLCKF